MTDKWTDTALLALRVGVGGALAAHGAQKLFGWFGGYGVSGTGQWMDSLGFAGPGKRNATLAGVAEFGGGTLLALGLATGPAGAAVAGNMIVAGSPICRTASSTVTAATSCLPHVRAGRRHPRSVGTGPLLRGPPAGAPGQPQVDGPGGPGFDGRFRRLRHSVPAGTADGAISRGASRRGSRVAHRRRPSGAARRVSAGRRHLAPQTHNV